MKEPSIYVHLGIKGFLIFFHMGANMLERRSLRAFTWALSRMQAKSNVY